MCDDDLTNEHDALVAVKWNEPLEVVLLALENGWATVDQLRGAIAVCRSRRPRIGELAVHEGKLSVSQVFRVLEHEATSGGLFGENAVKLGYLSPADLYQLLQEQAANTPKVWEVLLENGVLTEHQMAELKARVGSPLLRACSCPVIKIIPIRIPRENKSDEGPRRTAMKDWQSQTHVKWDCKYHVVIVPKYRQRVFFGKTQAADRSDPAGFVPTEGDWLAEGECSAGSCPHAVEHSAEVLGSDDVRILEREECRADSPRVDANAGHLVWTEFLVTRLLCKHRGSGRGDDPPVHPGTRETRA